MTPANAGRVLVAGSVNMDLVVTSPRHPRVGETVLGHAVTRFPGGKGSNQAVAAAGAGAPTELIGAVGDDDEGTQLRAFLERRGVGVTHLREVPGARSGMALVTVAEGENAVVVVSGANAHVTPDALAGVEVGSRDVLTSQFEIAEETVHAFFERGKAAGARTVLNPSPARAFSAALWKLSDVLVVNQLELRELCEMREMRGSDPPSLDQLRALVVSEHQSIVVTLGAEGCAVVTDAEVVRIPGRPVRALDTTGAGDCFLGFMAARLVGGDDLLTAAGVANVAGSLCVQRVGAGSSMPTADEVAAADGS